MQRDSRQVQKGLNKDQDKTPPYDSLGEEKDEESTPLEAAPTPAKLAAP